VLRELFEGLRDEYGSVDAFLDSIGIDAPLRAQLSARLTVPATS
jgi:hypothetical protein